MICGAHFAPEERAGLKRLADSLGSAEYDTYLPHAHGLEALACRHNAAPAPDDFSTLCRAVFFTEIHHILNCGALVYSMNGRTPDEGGAFKAAVAYAAGLPVLLYKDDRRSTFHGADNAMITGLSPAFSTVPRLAQVPSALTRMLNKHEPAAPPPALSELAEHGAGIIKNLPDIHSDNFHEDEAKLINKMRQAVDAVDNSQPEPAPDNIETSAAAAPDGVAYCSGPLFCPEEIETMGRIAETLEAAGRNTYLPHRDGVEAHVMNAVDSAVANAWLLRPGKTFVNRAVFCLDIFQLARCTRGFVCNLNGRAPDEGAVVEAGVALGLGLPLVFYKNDPRTLLPAGAHPVLQALMSTYPLVRDIEEIPAALAAAERTPRPQPDRDTLPPLMKKHIAFGEKVWNILHGLKRK